MNETSHSFILDMNAEDITNYSHEQACELRTTDHTHAVAISYGKDGCNGALLQGESGKLYKITARNSTLLTMI